jgi:hypothetical protein
VIDSSLVSADKFHELCDIISCAKKILDWSCGEKLLQENSGHTVKPSAKCFGRNDGSRQKHANEHMSSHKNLQIFIE